MRKILFILAMLVTCVAMAQPKCGFDGAHAQMLQLDSIYKMKVEAANTRWTQMMQQAGQNGLQMATGYGTEYEIPLVVHVIHTGGAVGTTYNPSDAAINSMINYLNETYAATYASYPDTNNGGVRFPIRFVLAKRSPSCGYTNGINRVDGSSLSGYSLYGVKRSSANGVSDSAVKSLSRWDNGDYYNIWIVNKIDSNDGTFGTYTAGYAYFPGASAFVDGTVMLATTVGAGNITLPHEIGHAFNLYHTFEGDNGGGSCPANNNCNTDGDLVCDTEPHKRSVFNCPSDPNPCTSSSYANVQRNFMDYSNCQDRFTPGQRTRWLDALTNDRSGLASSITTLDTNSVKPIAATCSTTINGANVNNPYEMGPVQVKLNDMTSSSGGYSKDGYVNYIDRTCRQRANIVAGKSYTLSVKTTTNVQNVEVYLDTSNNGSFIAAERIFSSTGTSAPQTHSTTYTVPTSNIPTCTPLRMRVLADFVSSTMPANGCGTLDYGQTEDFTVVVRPASDTVTMLNAITTGNSPTCAGSSVTFTASATKSLTSPTYQWYVNSQPVSGATNSTYTRSSLTAGTYYVKCKVKHSAACFTDSAFTNTVTLVVSGSTVTPAVSISSNKGTSICSGDTVTFTATPTNGGVSPTYQWRVNGVNVGANSNTYTTTSLSNGQIVTCKLTSSESCAVPDSAVSTGITMSVGATVTPSVSISSNKGSSICNGESVTFTATPTNGGVTPTYQWKVNGSNVGSNSNTYTTSSLTNGQTVTCEMTSSAACASPVIVTSSGITMTVTATVTPSVSISSNKGSSICTGESVTFTATPTNGGGSPTYQWKVNGSNVGSNSTTYTTSSLTNGQTVTCEMTSNAACASPAMVTSSGITMTVTATVTPSVTISSNKGTSICTGDTVTFTASPTNGGGAPTYQWKVNGSNVGGNSNIYITSSLTNGQTVTCEMTSNASCASPASATSTGITMSVSNSVVPSVTISSNKGSNICTGDTVTFTANAVNGGATTYQWKVNGSNVGSNSSTYTTTSLTNGQTVTCEITSSLPCASPTTATSTGITMTVNTTVTASVSISSNKGSSICSGETVTFTATPTNGGTPTYQWKVNGSNVGSNSNTYTTSSLTSGQTVTCDMTSSITCASPQTVTSSGITMTVSGSTASVSISSNKGTNICSGDTVTFTATPTNGGATPTYQWKVNGNNAGANSPTFTTTSLSNGSVVTCQMTSSSGCVSPATVTSNSLNMTVNANLTPIIAITVSPNDTICAGTNVTFSATIANGGNSPAYQWRVNSSNTGSNSNTFSTSSLTDGDVVTCILTSSLACVTSQTDTSNGITMKVNPLLTPVVSIAVNPNDTICAGTNTVFTATAANSGSSPTYQWKRNGVGVGTNSNTYNTTTLVDGDAIVCEMTSSEACLTKAKDTSNVINMTVIPNVTPSVSISVSPKDTVCAGTLVIFTATPTNGGVSPSYQWKRNGVNVGSNSNIFSSSSLSNGDVITCVMTSSITCVTSTTATSNSIKMTVNPVITPDVTITPSPNDTICAGTSVTFTATSVNGGTSPTYQWQLNGFNTGTNSNTFTSSTLSGGDVIRVIMASNGVCLTKPADTSNAVAMTVIPNVTPVIIITRTPTDTICQGTNVSFSTTIANGGSSPTYQWQVNGTNAGTNSPTFNSSSLSNGDVVRCYLVSSITCVTTPADTSNGITIGVKTKQTPDVAITVSPNDTICGGTNVTFTATATGAGSAPTYQWQVNGVDVGTNSNTYSTTSLTNGNMVRCIIFTSDTCVTKNRDTSNVINMTVNPILTPDVTISVSPDDTVCAGTNVTFTATPVNGGSNPAYQWRVNGVNAGTNSSTFSTSALTNGDVVDCILTTSESCVSKTKDTSAGITMTVKPNLVPDVTINVSPNDTICAGTGVTFVATPVNGGTTPAYQWQVNGSNVGSNVASYVSNTLANGDVVRCIMTSSEMCLVTAKDTSNNITMIVNPNLTPDVTITVSPDDTICAGTNVTFTATPVNGGSTPAYQWRVNGVNAGSNSSTFTTSTLGNGDIVECILTSSEVCVTKSTDTSNKIQMTVKPYLTPDVSITVTPNDTICAGTQVKFMATTVNGGTTPTYQWQVNGSNAGTNADSFVTTGISNNDVVRLILTSSEMCVTQSNDTSNNIAMTVIQNVTPDITITVSPNDTICAGTNVSFLANANNGGLAPVYQWQVNGVNVGINANGYTSSSFNNGDVVRCILTSSEVCVTKAKDTSNVVNMTVNPLTTPSVFATTNTGTTACIGGEVTFTANFLNGGTSQNYQWRINGSDVAGATNKTFTTNALANGDVVTCKMNITAVCPAPDSAISNQVFMNMVTPVVTVTALPNDTICDNQLALFTITATNVGNIPKYQWKLNGSDIVGATSDSITIGTVGHLDMITASFTGSDNCINAPATNGNTVTMYVNPTTAPVVSIAANPGNNIPNGQIVWFTSSANTPNVTYQWRRNGEDVVGATGLVYTVTDPKDGDTISLFIRTTDSCRIPDTAISNEVVLHVGVGVANVTVELFDEVNIAPNPNNGTFVLSGTMSAGRNDEEVMVEVINAVGAVIHKEAVPVRNHELKTKIELGDKAHNGLHIVRITAAGRVHLLKFIANR